MVLELKIEKRNKSENLKKLRKGGSIPAVFYGKKNESTPITISEIDFLKTWREAGESSVIILKGEDGDLEALIKDVDIDPVSDRPRHADFYVFEEGHKIEVDVPLEFVGVSRAVKDLGGILVKVMHSLPIKAVPKDLPHEIKVDISRLNDFEDLILAKDIPLPSGVELNENENEVVVSITTAKEEKEEETVVDYSTVEVEKKGKEIKEGENVTEEDKKGK